MAKTVFTDGDPVAGIPATIVFAAFLNALQAHRHDGADADGSAPIDYAVDTGAAANDYVVALTPPLTAYIEGMLIRFRAAHTNTGASTLNINGVGAKPIYGLAHAALQGGEILAGGDVWLAYNAALNAGNGAWVLLCAGGGALQVPAATQSRHALNREAADARYLAAISGAQRGDIIYYGADGWMRLAKGTSGYWLRQGADDPAWSQLDFTASLDLAGYQKLPSGLVIQWGAANMGSSTEKTFSFPIAFPNACFRMAGIQPGAGGTSTQCTAHAISATQYTAYASVGNCNLHWIAVGN